MKKILILIFYISLILQSCNNQVQKETTQNKSNVQEEVTQNKAISQSGITYTNLSASSTRDLIILCKVWGFLKYYHPTVAQGIYNWDKELFRLMPLVLQAKSLEHRNNILLEWVGSLGQISEGDSSKPDASAITLLPDLSWISPKALGEELTGKLMLIKKAKRTGSNYYVSLGLYIKNKKPSFEKEESYANIKNPDLGFRLLALFRYWNIIQYFHPYRTLTDNDWHAILQQAIPLFVEAKGDLQYQLAISALMAQVDDTHATISGEISHLRTSKGDCYAPVGISFIQGKPVVTHYRQAKRVLNHNLLVGDILESVNGKDIVTITKEKLPYTSASNSAALHRIIAGDLLRTNDTTLQVTFKRGKVSQTAQIRCFPREELDFQSRSFRTDVAFRLLEPDIAYLLPGRLQKGAIYNLLPEIAKTKAMVIDLRLYPTDFIVYSLGEFLMPEAKPFAKMTEANILSPGQFTFREPLKVGKFNPGYYKGKIVILVNESTQSQGEFSAMAFRCAPSAIIIGSQTAGADGDVTSFFLPGGIRTTITGKGVYYPNGDNTQRTGIKLDLEVKPTIQGIKQGKDEILEKAVELLKKEKTAYNNS